jgi:hypothetical protein
MTILKGRGLMRICFYTVLVCCLFFVPIIVSAQQSHPVEWRKSALKSTAPSDEIVRLDIDQDGKPDIIERWWNGKRVRWLDENNDMKPTDTRGDQVNDVIASR